jgi:hypothetical protein
MTSQGLSCTLRLLRLLGRSANMSFEIQFVHRLSQLASNTVKLTYVGSYFSVQLALSRCCLSKGHNGKPRGGVVLPHLGAARVREIEQLKGDNEEEAVESSEEDEQDGVYSLARVGCVLGRRTCQTLCSAQKLGRFRSGGYP